MRVYSMRMARVNVYLPDELAEAARSGGLNVSALTQDALRRALAVRHTDEWLASLTPRPPTRVTHEHVIAALSESRDDFG